MALTTLQLKRKLDQKFSESKWKTSFNRDEDKYRVELAETGIGVNIALPNVLSKHGARGDVAIDELVYHVKTSLDMMNKDPELKGNEKNIFPVIRSTSFPVESKAGDGLITHDHTAETRVYYALDFGNTYQLIDENILESSGWSVDHLKEIAIFNLKSLPIDLRQDTVAGNDFYFVTANDGYDASRILNESWLEEMAKEAKGDLALATPHQDTLIVADIQNEMGYDILAQMTIHYFTEGRVPITALPFLYEDKVLEPIFILANKKPVDETKQKDKEDE